MLLIFTTFHNSTLEIYDIVSMTYSFNFQGWKSLFSHEIHGTETTSYTRFYLPYNDYLKVKIKIYSLLISDQQ